MHRHPETEAIRIQTARTQEQEHSTPLFLTSSFVYESAEDMAAAFADDSLDVNIYSRFSNPSVDEFVRKMCVLEGAEDGVATASGMAAIFATFMALLSQGDHLISASAVFGSTHTILTKYLPKWGIAHSYFDMRHPETIARNFRPETRLVYVETPSNPGLDIIDIAALAGVCHERGVLLVVDNCFATPAVQQPLLHGADLVIHSATKFLDGQGRVLGGVVVGRRELIRPLYLFLRNTGPSMSAFNAWVLSKSLETLHVRMERHAATASSLAEALTGHPALRTVRYPFLPTHPAVEVARRQMRNGGGLITFELVGGRDAGVRFLNRLRMLSMTNNLGDTRSIASHPASTTHAKLTEDERLAVGITPGLIRISVGLEHRDDILSDILQALGD